MFGINVEMFFFFFQNKLSQWKCNSVPWSTYIHTYIPYYECIKHTARAEARAGESYIHFVMSMLLRPRILVIEKYLVVTLQYRHFDKILDSLDHNNKCRLECTKIILLYFDKRNEFGIILCISNYEECI